MIPSWSRLVLAAMVYAVPSSALAQDPEAPPEQEEAKPGEVTANPRFVPGKGLSFESDDGQFAMAMRLRAQFLYTGLHEPEEEEPLVHSFQIRRARLQFGGHVFGENNRYKTELAFSPRDEGVDGGPTITPLLDWYAELTHVRDLHLRVGQYKVPFNRQRVISSGDLQLVDRSIVQSEFNLDRDVGLHVFSPDLGGLGVLKYYAGAWINQGRDAMDAAPLHPMYIARVEVLPFGKFADYSEVDFARGEPGLSIGAAYAFLDDATSDRGILGDPFPDGGTADLHTFTGDVLFKGGGFSLLSEGYLRRGERTAGDAVDELGEPITAEPVRDGVGWFVQAGYLLGAVPLEVSARYDDLSPSGTGSALEEAHAAGGGASWYFAEHSLKLQGDYFRLWGADGPSAGADQVRMQLQLAY